MFHQRRYNNYLPLAVQILKSAFQHTSFHDLYAQAQENTACRLSDDGRTMKPSLRSVIEDELQLANRQQLEEEIQAFFKYLKSDPVTIYDVLFYFADSILYPRRDTYRYRYEYTDIWRNYTRFLDEELVVAAAVLLNETRRGNRRDFPVDWTYCVNCDNAELMAMLNRDDGISENHFHLRGSSPYFYVSWIYLMNHVDHAGYENNIEKLEQNRLTQNFSSVQGEPLRLLWRKAAAIRLYLYLYVSESSHTFQHFNLDRETVRTELGSLIKQEDSLWSLGTRIPMKKLVPYYRNDADSFLLFKKHCLDGMYRWLQKEVLSCDSLTYQPITLLQEEIAACEVLHDGQIDYAQVKGDAAKQYYHLQGERYLLTQVLRKIRFKTIGYERAEGLLYLYLLMKHQFRSELVQSNMRNGFYNFEEFQSRKSLFVPWVFEEELATDTISSIIEDTKLHRAELRITPEETAQEDADIIQMYDRAIDAAISKAESLKQKNVPQKEQFFYTFHFFKVGDSSYHQLQCRNHVSRVAAQKRGEAILLLRSQNTEIAQRIYGIDACAAEILCRPETFGPIFRRLQYYDPSVQTINHSGIPQLMATYHVGEDNFDIVDSLRAIDEALLFLELRSGCRLGHATYLGIPPKEYYEHLHHHISMPVQVWLDNSVWMYYFMKEHSISFEGSSLLMHFLEEQFSRFFKEIYQDALTSGNLDYRLEHLPPETYSDPPKGYEQCIFSLYHYYLSWMLRGDEPELYVSGYLKRPDSIFEEYQLCNTREEMEAGRDCFEATFLYHLYHFDQNTKIQGAESISISIPEYYIHGVEEIQRVLREKVTFMGIGIETNPTSNLYISTIRSYAEHPITVFYDYGLLPDTILEQVNVSINTDDKSVFSTSLVNEYAYLLFFLENQRDADGNKKYTRLQVMQWLNQIRIMGNEQSFAN